MLIVRPSKAICALEGMNLLLSPVDTAAAACKSSPVKRRTNGPSPWRLTPAGHPRASPQHVRTQPNDKRQHQAKAFKLQSIWIYRTVQQGGNHMRDSAGADQQLK